MGLVTTRSFVTFKSDTAATDSFDGGAGTDTLSVTTGANVAAANMGRYSNFERLDITDGGETIDLTSVSMFSIIVVLKP